MQRRFDYQKAEGQLDRRRCTIRELRFALAVAVKPRADDSALKSSPVLLSIEHPSNSVRVPRPKIARSRFVNGVLRPLVCLSELQNDFEAVILSSIVGCRPSPEITYLLM